jgi:hypothetical protein
MSKKFDEKWLQKQILKDELEIETYKKSIIESLKTKSKEDLFEKPEKMTLWKRIIKSLNL